MHGDPPERVAGKIADLRQRRAQHNSIPLEFGVAGYAIVRETEKEAQDEVRRVTDVQQSAAGYANYQQWLAGNPTRAARLSRRLLRFESRPPLRPRRHARTVSERLHQFEKAGVDLVLLQFSPQLEEMERFASAVIGRKAVSAS